MPVEDYLTDRERTKATLQGRKWRWVLTNERLIRYRELQGGDEEFGDLSLNQVDSVSLENEDATDSNQLALVATIAGLVMGAGGILVAATEPASQSDMAPIALVGIGLFFGAGWYYYQSLDPLDDTRIELSGVGLLADDPWRIVPAGDVSRDDAVAFIRELREVRP